MPDITRVKQKKETIVYIISFPISDIHNGDVHVCDERLQHETLNHY